MSIVTKCPVCFTKMNAVGHDLVCPECGYKYCEKKDPYSYDDHNHNEYRSYNQKTSYTTSTSSSSSSSTAVAQQSRPSAPPSQQSRPSVSPVSSSSTGSPQKVQRPAKLIIGIVIFYFIMVFIMSIGGIILNFLHGIFPKLIEFYME